MNAIHSAVKAVLDTKTYTNSIAPNAYSGSNNISGGNTGNVIVNANYQFNCKMIRPYTNTVYCYTRIGEDNADYSISTTPNTGSLVKRVFDIPSRTWSANDVVIYEANAGYCIGSFRVYIINGSIWIYASKQARAATLNPATSIIVLFKSTDGLVGESFVETAVGLTGEMLETFELCDAQDGSKFMIVGNGSPKLKLLRSTDGGNTFTYDASVNFNTSTLNITEGKFIQMSESPNVIFGVLRDNNGNYLQETVSNDYGLTWSNPVFSTGLGAATGAKVTPKMLRAANNPNSVVMYFIDRGNGNRNMLSGVTSIANFKANTQNSAVFLGTLANQGNGDFIEIDKNKQIYLVVSYLQTTNASGIPSAHNTNTVWWLWQDLYTKSISPAPYQ